MTDSTTRSDRPLSPHIQIYRWPITMAMSIAHRASGGALYIGTIFLAIWLIAVACGEDALTTVNSIYGSWIGLIILFFYTLALVHHLVGGIRHLFWDSSPRLLEKHLATKTAWATVYISVIVTVVLWIVGFMVR